MIRLACTMICTLLLLTARGPAAGAARNSCLEFDGDSAIAVVHPADGLKTLNGSGLFTFEAWIKPRSQGGGGRGRILQQRDGNIYWYLSDDTRFGFRAGSKAGWRLSEERAINYWEWQHIAVTSDGGNLRYYVNGKLVYRARKAITLDVSGGDVMIGNGYGEDQQPRGFDGWIDELRISNVCLYTKDFTPARSFDYDSTTVMLFHFDEPLSTPVALDATTYNAEIRMTDPVHGTGRSPRRTPVE